MLGDYFFIGRAERIVIAILLTIAITGFAVYAFSVRELRHDAVVVVQTGKASPSSSTDSLLRTKDYVGPPQHLSRGSTQKFAKRIILDLNQVDSLTLLRVPGIGPAFAHRILHLRSQLGGYYTILQLQEVYGVDADKYLALRSWFRVGTLPKRYYLDELIADELPEHRYLSWTHRKALSRLIYRYGRVSRWSQLMRDGAFSRDDSTRLSHYFIERKASTDSLVHAEVSR